jgi:hypothetical protein
MHWVKSDRSGVNQPNLLLAIWQIHIWRAQVGLLPNLHQAPDQVIGDGLVQRELHRALTSLVG